MEQRIGQEIGNYRLIRLLGSGSLAEVYLAKHLKLETDAAIKLLHAYVTDDAAKKDFITEGRLVAQLKHRYIVRVFDFGFEQTTPYLVMDYIPNGTLRERYPKGTRLPLETIVLYVNKIAIALQYAHNRNIVHCDVKPENILLRSNDDIALSDFGIALILQSTLSQRTQDPAGTPAYMAPEQFRGKPRAASDQYALGAIVYEWLCGKQLFTGKTFLQLMDKHLNAKPKPLRSIIPTVPAAVEQVVLKALAKDPKERFKSVQAFGQALRQASLQTQKGWSTDDTQIDLPASSLTESSSPLLLSEVEVFDEIASQGDGRTSADILPPVASLAASPDIPSKDLPLNAPSLPDHSERKRYFSRYAFIGSLIILILFFSSTVLLINSGRLSTLFSSSQRQTPTTLVAKTVTILGTPSVTPPQIVGLESSPHRATLQVHDLNGLLHDSPQAINDIKMQVRNLPFLHGRNVGFAIAYGGAPSLSDVTQANELSSKVYSILRMLAREGFAFTRTSYYEPLFLLGGSPNIIVLDLYLYAQ